MLYLDDLDAYCVEMNCFVILVCFFLPSGAGEPEEAGRDNPSAHGRVREHHH